MGVQEVKIVHGETGDEAYVSEEAAEAYAELGWTLADDGSSEEAQDVADHPIETQVEATKKKTTKEG
jgi:hypothetical protein